MSDEIEKPLPLEKVKAIKYPYPLVEVLWWDAETTNGWEAEDEVEPEVPLVVTVGFLVQQNEKLVCVASSTGDDRSHNSRMVIPIGMVAKLRVMKKAHVPRSRKK